MERRRQDNRKGKEVSTSDGGGGGPSSAGEGDTVVSKTGEPLPSSGLVKVKLIL